jgi:tRNA(fMet)-specific endonuclease VapC
MSRLCLDTCAYSNLKRNHPPVAAAIDNADWIGVPSIVVGELMAGFRQGGRAAENHADLLEFLRHPLVDELKVDRATAECYSELVLLLKRAGTPIPSNDIWIAATCICAGATLLTYDEHFTRIQRLGSWVLSTTQLLPPAP